MSQNNQALARKWRPQLFSQVMGQDVAVKALSHALNTNRLHHAYLFTGTRGVGKTTISRLLAKSLSCEQGVQAIPCGICANCIAMANSSYIDYIELDAASNRGVEEISKLLENAAYQPSQGRYKIFMIDEVHMLSNHAFNAMLKTLEEPPAHVKFILATTDAHKIPMTVLSRCLQFHLQNISPPNIVQYLTNILLQENIAHEEQALQYIAKSAHGSMRDALSITDQAIAIGSGAINTSSTQSMLGLVDDRLSIDILNNLINDDGSAMLSLAKNIQNAPAFIDNMLAQMQNIAIIQCVPSSISTIDSLFKDELQVFANKISAKNIQIFYQMCIKAKQDIEYCDAYISINMLLLRMLSFTIEPQYIAQSVLHPTNIIKPILSKPEQTQHSSTPTPAPTPSIISTTIQKQNNHNISDNISSNIQELSTSTWLEYVKQLKHSGIDGLSLEIARQSEFITYDAHKKSLRLKCAFDTKLMRSAVGKLQKVLADYFMTPDLSLNFSSLENSANISRAALISSSVLDKSQQNIDNNINIKSEIEYKESANIRKNALAEMDTVAQSEQNQKQAYIDVKTELIKQDPWAKDFINIGAKIIDII
jgi:DNA polymerase III subunit gamma/tau